MALSCTDFMLKNSVALKSASGVTQGRHYTDIAACSQLQPPRDASESIVQFI